MKISLDTELKALKRQNSELIDANIKLADELKWAKEDKERALRRLNTAIEYVRAEKTTNNDKVRQALDKYEKIMLEILEDDYFE